MQQSTFGSAGLMRYIGDNSKTLKTLEPHYAIILTRASQYLLCGTPLRHFSLSVVTLTGMQPIKLTG